MMGPFERVFHDELPVSGRAARHWATQNRAALDGAAAKIEAHGANPWVFTADGRMFRQFAGAAEYAALAEMSPEELAALLPWTEEEWEQI
jgi:hypothetical protein